MPAKQYYMQFHPGDWLKDPKLSMCSPWTRGIWMDLLCAMHEAHRSGELKGSVDQLARVARCGVAEMENALAELEESKTADIGRVEGIITVINRRMKREAAQRRKAADRQKQHRDSVPVSHKFHAENSPMSQQCHMVQSPVVIGKSGCVTLESRLSHTNVTISPPDTPSLDPNSQFPIIAEKLEKTHECAVKEALSPDGVPGPIPEQGDGLQGEVVYAPTTIECVRILLNNIGAGDQADTDEVAKAYWLSRERTGWRVNGQKVHSWRADCEGYYHAVKQLPRFAAEMVMECQGCGRISDLCTCPPDGREKNWLRVKRQRRQSGGAPLTADRPARTTALPDPPPEDIATPEQRKTIREAHKNGLKLTHMDINQSDH